AAGVGPQVEPGLLAVVSVRQVEDEAAAAAAGYPGGHSDEVTADGGGAGLGVAGPGPGSGGSQQVMGHGGKDEPCGVRVEVSRWQMREGTGVQVGDDLLDDRVVPVVSLGRGRLERGIGEDGIMPVD